jgi:glycosyltransferase involved in cell wall biosynthesis
LNENFVAIIIPAFNESEQLGKTLTEVTQHFSIVIVVDDGSSDATFEIARKFEVTVIRHPINLGQGAALQTGIAKALQNSETNFFITFDADGQHSIKSALEMLQVARDSNVDVVLGSRFLNNSYQNMPFRKKVVLKLAIIFTRIDTGLKITDTHNGLRIFNRKFAESLNIQKFGMAHASEILDQVKFTGASWVEAPAHIKYSEYSIKKGQSIFNAINILTEMIHK